MSKCLLFDCDGTLVDSEVLNCEAMSAELLQSGIDEDSSALFHRYKGGNFFEVLVDLQRRHGIALDDQFTERFRQRASDHFREHLKSVAGVRESLESLSNARCVVSNAPRNKIEHELELTDLLQYFAGHIYSAYEIGHWKPAPDLLLHAAKNEGYSPADCLVIEDSAVGVQAALNAGMSVILYDPAESAIDLAADIKINAMSELPDAIARL